MGEVYRAWDERLERPVAIKVIRRSAAAGDDARRRFRREARAAAALDHPAVVKVHQVLATEQGDAIVMELVAGSTLAAALRREGGFAVERAVRLGLEIAGGLAAAHALGIVHRDLKTENVMVTPAGHAKVLDFGLARRRAEESEEHGESLISQDGAVVGTYRAMSPEQARGVAIDHRSDLFSFGTLLYEMVAGRSPFLGASAFATLTNVCTLRQPPARALNAAIPAALSDLIDRLLEKEPAHRPQSAQDVVAALAALAAAGGPAAAASRAPAGAAAPPQASTVIDGLPASRQPGAATSPPTLPAAASGASVAAAASGAPVAAAASGASVAAAASGASVAAAASGASVAAAASGAPVAAAASGAALAAASAPSAAAAPSASAAEPPTVASGPPSSAGIGSTLATAFAVAGRRRVAVAAGLSLALILSSLAGLALWRSRDASAVAPPLAVAVLAPQVAVAGADPSARGGSAAPAGTAAVAGPSAATSAAPPAASLSADLLASIIRSALLRGLLSRRGISAIAPEQVDPVPGPPVAVARATGADELLTAAIRCGAGAFQCRVALARLRGADGRLLWEYAFDVPAGDPYAIEHAVESQIHLGYPRHPAREGFAHLEVASAAAYREYLDVQRDFTRRGGTDRTSALLARLAALRRGSPRFLEAALLEAEILRYRFRDHRDAADLARAFDLLAAARGLVPGDPAPLITDFSLSLEAGRLERAAADLQELERLQPGDPVVLAQRARLAERRGATAAALALQREACRRRPSWGHYLALADMEYRLGEAAAARRDLYMLLARAPGIYPAQSLLAQIELLSGSPARAADLYVELLRRSPQETEVINLGTAYMLLRRYPEAAARFREALASEPDNPFVTLNLADVLLLQGDAAAAHEQYRRLLRLTAEDPAAGQWQVVSARAQALAHLGQRLPAVAAAQQVLALAPGNAQAESEVAVVFAVLGDHASAVWNAQQALRQGVDPRWFSFPWFDALRSAPELRDRLTAGPPPL